MSRRQRTGIILGVFFCMIMCGCERVSPEAEQVQVQQESWEQDNSEEGTEKVPEEAREDDAAGNQPDSQINDLTDAIETILDQADKDFIVGGEMRVEIQRIADAQLAALGGEVVLERVREDAERKQARAGVVHALVAAPLLEHEPRRRAGRQHGDRTGRFDFEDFLAARVGGVVVVLHIGDVFDAVALAVVAERVHLNLAGFLLDRLAADDCDFVVFLHDASP